LCYVEWEMNEWSVFNTKKKKKLKKKSCYPKRGLRPTSIMYG
jgi:hypothetical protein